MHGNDDRADRIADLSRRIRATTGPGWGYCCRGCLERAVPPYKRRRGRKSKGNA